MLRRTLVLALFPLFVGCVDDVEVPSRVALWKTFEARVEADRRPTEPLGTVVFHDAFEEPSSAWTTLIDPADPLKANDVGFKSRFVQSEGNGRLSLSGPVGGLYQFVDVEPGSFVDVSARVRLLDVEPQNSKAFAAGTLFVGELNRRGTPEEVFRDGPDNVLLSRKTLNLVGRDGSWGTTSRQFRTSDETQCLVIMCLLATADDVVASGAVEFDDVSLRILEESDYRLAQAEGSGGTPAELAARHGGSSVRVSVGAESRPSLLVLPGRSVTMDVVVPRGQPVLSMGVAPWGIPKEIAPTLGYSLMIDGDELLAVEAPANSRAVNHRWRDLELDLSAYAGGPASLEFTALHGPVVFGAPLLVDRSVRQPGPNLVLISIDTLRADHVGVYGYEGETTPHLDALANEGQLFSDMTAQAPYTLPSHATMFSGQMPSVHGVVGPGRSIAPSRTPMLAELLFDAGVTTRAFTAGGYIDPEFGFDRGFEGYSNVDPWRYPNSPHGAEMVRRSPATLSSELLAEYTPHAIEGWIEEHAKERFFLFVHSYTVHDFDPPPGYLDERERIDPMPFMHHEYVLTHGITPEEIRDITDYYDAALRYVDELVGSLVAKLDELGLADDTIVAVTSDHGKELGERGLVIHGTTLYEELVAVPMILRVPGVAQRVESLPVMSVDLAPTLLVAMGLEIDERMQGLDLLDARVSLEDRPVWSELDQLGRKYTLRDSSGLKLIHGPMEDGLYFPNERPWELYDLETDPGELSDLSDDQLEARKRLGEQLGASRAAFEALGDAYGNLGSGEMSAETRARLEQLGYF